MWFTALTWYLSNGIIIPWQKWLNWNFCGLCKECVICYTLTNSSHRAVLLEKLIVVQLVINFPPLWNPVINNSVQCAHSSPLTYVLIQTNPLHILPFCFLKIQFNDTLSAVPSPCAHHMFRQHTGIQVHYITTGMHMKSWKQQYTCDCVQLTASFADGIRKLRPKRCKEKLRYFFKKLYCICCKLLWNKIYFFCTFIGILNSDFFSG